MNNTRRKQIKVVRDALEKLSKELDTIRTDEQEYMDNMPEAFQDSEKYSIADEAVSNLDDAISSVDEAVTSLEF